jgi:hypothetical protein
MKQERLHIFYGILISLFLLTSTGLVKIEAATPPSPSSAGGQSPVASAGPDQTVNGGTKNIILDGSKSYDLNGKITSYSWKQIGGPSVNLNSTKTHAVKFDATCETTNSSLTFGLTVKNNKNATSSPSLTHVRVVFGPSSSICKEAVFTSSSLPIALSTGKSFPFKLNLGIKFDSISRVIAISRFDRNNPFGDGGKYSIKNFGAQNSTGGSPNETIAILGRTDPSTTSQFLNGNFTSDYASLQGKFTLTALKFCLNGVPANVTKSENKTSSLSSTNNLKNIEAECNVTPSSSSSSTTKNASEAKATTPPKTLRTNSTSMSTPRYQYSLPQQYSASPYYPYGYPPYQSPYQYPYQSPYQYPYQSPYQYPYPNANSPYYPPSPYPYQYQPPIANAGPSQVVSPGALVVLNGAGSYDPSGGSITSYQWQQIGGTPFVGLTGANTPTPTFTAPFVTAGTTLTFRLIVTNSYGLTASSTVNVSVTPNNINQPPIANAGPSQVVRPGALVVLNGAGSFDPSGGTIISYSWVQTAGPTVSLSGANTATPTFIAPGAAIFLSFSLTVTNSGGLVSSPSTVFISVR